MIPTMARRMERSVIARTAMPNATVAMLIWTHAIAKSAAKIVKETVEVIVMDRVIRAAAAAAAGTAAATGITTTEATTTEITITVVGAMEMRVAVAPIEPDKLQVFLRTFPHIRFSDSVVG